MLMFTRVCHCPTNALIATVWEFSAWGSRHDRVFTIGIATVLNTTRQFWTQCNADLLCIAYAWSALHNVYASIVYEVDNCACVHSQSSQNTNSTLSIRNVLLCVCHFRRMHFFRTPFQNFCWWIFIMCEIWHTHLVLGVWVGLGYWI